MSSTQSCWLSIMADANSTIGYGHLRRTLAVAEQFRTLTKDISIRYLMKTTSDTQLVRTSGYDIVYRSEATVSDLHLVISPLDGPILLDSYEISESDLNSLHQNGFCIFMFEDSQRLARYTAQVVIDFSPGAEQFSYRGLETTCFCLGPAYFPVRSEFLKLQGKQKSNTLINRIVVTFGGSDPDDQTARIAKLFVRHPHQWKVLFILGPGYTGQAEKFLVSEHSLTGQRNVPNMASALATADLAIAGAGMTALELAYLGVPTLLIGLSREQHHIATALEQAGVAIYLGKYEHVRDEKIWETLQDIASNTTQLTMMRNCAQAFIDGQGAARIAQIILNTWNNYKL